MGRATAEHYARLGAHVIMLARSTDKLEQVAHGIVQNGGQASYYAVDLSDAEAVAATAERIESDLGTPDIIINNAGAGRWLPLVETPPEDARQMIELPYLAAFYVTRMFLPAMIARGHGHVACVTSPASYIVWPNACGYIAARHALRGFTEAMRREMRGTGVGVTLVVLGTVSSPYWSHNPGSREHLPATLPMLMPELTTEQAAKTIVGAIEKGKSRVVRPWFYRVLIALNLNG